MRILVYGAGSIGAWLAAGMSTAGHQVTCIARQPFVDAVRESGLTVLNPDDTAARITNLTVYTSLIDLLASSTDDVKRFDAILLCVKAYSLQAAVDDLACNMQLLSGDAGSRPLIVCFQNGVGCDEIACLAFGKDNVIAATTTTPVSSPEAGVIRTERSGGAIAYAACGQYDLTWLGNLFHGAAPVTISCEDYRSLRWSKLLLNIMGNASGAILDLPAASIYEDGRTFRMEMAMMRECIAVARRLNVRLVNLPGFPSATLAWAIQKLPHRLLQPILLRQIAKGRGNKRPSLYIDVANVTGHSEVTWLNGAIVKYGQSVGVPAPVNARLTRLLCELVSGRDLQMLWRGQIHRLISE